jgi:hypothetical protein
VALTGYLRVQATFRVGDCIPITISTQPHHERVCIAIYAALERTESVVPDVARPGARPAILTHVRVVSEQCIECVGGSRANRARWCLTRVCLQDGVCTSHTHAASDSVFRVAVFLELAR